MFSDKEIQAYKKISAPPELYGKIKSSVTTKSRFIPSVVIKTVGAVAACFIIAVAIMMFGANPEPDIICNGQELQSSMLFYDISPASDKRESSVLSVPFEIELREDTEIVLSCGRLVTSEGESVDGILKKGKLEIWWEIPESDKKIDCEMVLKGEKTTTVITLTYDNAKKAVRATKTTK